MTLDLTEICFIISPIDDVGTEIRKRADTVLDKIVLPACNELGLKAVRADGILESGLITNQIVRHLVNDAVVVADLTGLNGNVLYELGIRHAEGRNAVHLMEVGGHLPFNLTNLRVVFYDLRTADSILRSHNEVLAHITNCLKPGHEQETPYSTAARGYFFSKWEMWKAWQASASQAIMLQEHIYFERIYSQVFGSQIFLLRILEILRPDSTNHPQGMPLIEVRGFYDIHVRATPSAISFAEWLSFLTARSYLISEAAGHFVIAERGRQFLLYLLQNSLPDKDL